MLHVCKQLADKNDAGMLNVCEQVADKKDDAGMLNMCEQLADKAWSRHAQSTSASSSRTRMARALAACCASSS